MSSRNVRSAAPIVLVLVVATLLAISACSGGQARKAKYLQKGQVFMTAMNYEKARVEFQNALQVAPKDPDTRFAMGMVDEKLQKTREAAQFYQSVIDVAPLHVGARTQLARLYLFSALPDKALELIEPVLKTHPDDAELLTVRAAIRVQKSDLPGAKEDAERAVHLAPADENAVAVLSGVYSSQGETAKAQSLLEESLTKIPNSGDLRLVLAQIYLKEDRRDKAEALLLKLVELQPAVKSHRLLLARFYVEEKAQDAAERTLREMVKAFPSDREVKISLIQFLAANRSRDVAERELKSMIAIEPGDNELKFALAGFYQEGGQDTQAETIYRGLIADQKLTEAGLRARDRLAELRLKGKDTAGALALVGEVLAKSPRDDDALALRGTISLTKQDPRSAIADLRAVLRDQPNSIGVIRTLARAHLANGEPAIAEETMRTAVEANPKNAVLQLEFAQLLTQIGKAQQAEPIVADVVKAHPDNLEALDSQFRIAMTTQDLATAKLAAEAIVALRPKSPIGYLYQGAIAEAEKRPEDALAIYSHAVDLAPQTAEPLEAEIRMLVNLKRVPQALKRLDDISNQFPKIALALDMKGKLLAIEGRDQEAQEVFKSAIARAPSWWEPYRGLAYAQMAQDKNPDAAIATLRSAKSVVAQKEPVRAALAALLERVGKIDDSIAEYNEMARESPDSEIAANNLAMLLVTYKQDQVSLDRAKSLVSRFANSPNPSFMDTYGWVLFKHGDAAASVPVLKQVVAAVPDEAIPRYHLGMAQVQSGDTLGARENLNRAVKSGAQFSGLVEARAALDKLDKSPPAIASTPKG